MGINQYRNYLTPLGKKLAGLAGALIIGGVAYSSFNGKRFAGENSAGNLAYAKYTAQFEGRRNKVYDPNPKDEFDEPTIGVGHFMGRNDSKQTFEKVLPGVDYDAVKLGR